MNISELRVDKTAKINIGNYENRDISLGLTIQVKDDDDIEAVFSRASDWLDRKMKESVAKLKSR
jgi:hypothetical protein